MSSFPHSVLLQDQYIPVETRDNNVPAAVKKDIFRMPGIAGFAGQPYTKTMSRYDPVLPS